MVRKSVKNFGDRVEVILAGSKMLHDICHEQKIYNVFRGVKAGRTFEEEIRLQVASKNMAKDEYNEELLFVYDITTEEDFRGSSIIKLLALKRQITMFLQKLLNILQKEQNNSNSNIF